MSSSSSVSATSDFNYGGDWTQAATTRRTYLADKAIIQQVLASWRWLE